MTVILLNVILLLIVLFLLLIFAAYSLYVFIRENEELWKEQDSPKIPPFDEVMKGKQ